MTVQTTPNVPVEDHRALLKVRMSLPEFSLEQTDAQPENLSATTSVYIDHLLDLGFIYSHEIYIRNPAGKHNGEVARIIAYLNVTESSYALITDLYHNKFWVYFTSYFAQGNRFVTTSQPGALILEPADQLAQMTELQLVNAGSSSLESQWRRHKQHITSEFPDEQPLLLQPEQNLLVERGFYLRYLKYLLDSDILQQSDTQTVQFSNSGARAYHAAITSRSARRPQPKIEEWIGTRGKLPGLKKALTSYPAALAACGIIAGLTFLVFDYQPDAGEVGPVAQLDSNVNTVIPALPESSPTTEPTIVAKADQTANTGDDNDGLRVLHEESEDTQLPAVPALTTTEIKNLSSIRPDSATIEKEDKTLPAALATPADEMWHIAVENAEFYLLSNDGDPAPWVRTAKRIAAAFDAEDPRLARTYFLSALLERDYLVAEHQYNRALSIQTKSLGLYHAETAQTLEALAWLAERNKDELEEAITHQRLALNIYQDIYGSTAEDTKAARWKLEYFQDRLAGKVPKTDENRRLLPALAKFSR